MTMNCIASQCWSMSKLKRSECSGVAYRATQYAKQIVAFISCSVALHCAVTYIMKYMYVFTFVVYKLLYDFYVCMFVCIASESRFKGVASG